MQPTPPSDAPTSLHLKYKEEIIAIFILICISAIAFTFADTNKKEKTKEPITTSRQSVKAWKSSDDVKKEGKIKKSQNILSVNISLDTQASSALNIVSTKVRSGYISRITPSSKEYSLVLLDNAGKTVKTFSFDLPDEAHSHSLPQEKSGLTRSEDLKLTKGDFTINMPFDSSATSVHIMSADGNIVASKSLTNETATLAPALMTYTVNGADFLASVGTGSVTLNATSTATNTIDIVLLGDKYTDLNQYHDDINRFVTRFLSVEPYKSRASQIVFHYIDVTTPLDCGFTQDIFLVCNNTKIMNAVNAAGVPYDYISVIVNTPTFGGTSSGLISAQYNGPSGPAAFVHELGGHSIGKLADEFIINITFGNMLNCVTSTTTTSWKSVVAPEDTYLGCDFPNYYRSSRTSIMLDVEQMFFNVKSQESIKKELDTLAGVFVDTTSPTSVITFPTDQAVVSGIVNVTPIVSDDNGVVRVELLKDGKLFHTEYMAPFTSSWPSMIDTNGPHTLQVKAYDAAGNVGVSPVVTVTTDNSADTEPPVVVIRRVYPDIVGTSTVTLGDNLWLSINASSTDNSGFVKKLELWDGTKVLASIPGPSGWLQYYFGGTSYVGKHTFVVKAYDYNNNVASLTQVLTLVAPPDVTPPVVTISKPVNGTKLSKSGSTTISATASDASGLSQMQIFLDGKNLKTCLSTTSCSTSVSNSTVTTGAHTISVNAKDKAGNIATSTVSVTK